MCQNNMVAYLQSFAKIVLDVGHGELITTYDKFNLRQQFSRF